MTQSVLVLGSGPIRIGQGIEFDYSCVHCVWTLREMGFRAVIVNNNPETVSTDFDTGDGLYFEPVTLDDVLDVINEVRPIGVACQFGGQTAINLAVQLERRGIRVLGTSAKVIELAEDRGQFDRVLEKLQVRRPKGRAVASLNQALEVVEEIGFPVLVRPSFVLGGRAMEIVFSKDRLKEFYRVAQAENPDQPVLVDQYLPGREVEVDAICDGDTVLIPGVMEHVERAGIHSGDSIAVYPPISISPNVQSQMIDDATRIGIELGVKGLMNIQFVIAENEAREETAYVLEVNPRASRTVPFLSKVTGVPMVSLATRCMMGGSLRELGYLSGLWVPEGMCRSRSDERSIAASVPAHSLPGVDVVGIHESFSNPPFFAVKAPVFSFQKLGRVEPSLGPEMKSTGEIMGIDRDFDGALYKAFVASGIQFQGSGKVLLSVKDADKEDCVAIGETLVGAGKSIIATRGTAASLKEAGIDCTVVSKIQEGSPNILDAVMSGEVSLMINTPDLEETSEGHAAQIRRACIETGIACVTSIDTARALARAINVFHDPSRANCLRLDEYLGSAKPMHSAETPKNFPKPK